MAVGSAVSNLLERFRDGCSVSQLHADMLASGVAESECDAISNFVNGPCREKRILIADGDAHTARELSSRPPYLDAMFEVFSPSVVNRVSALSQHLYARAGLVLGGALVIAAMCSMFLEMRALLLPPVLGASEILAVGAIAAFGILLHEFGHAAAAYRLGARRVSIGAGLYLVIPVAYSELSELWRYPRRSRVVVDLAGVYMQGLVLIGLMLLFHLRNESIWLVAASTTAASMLWNLNPFLRMDGYWVVADALGVHDLRRQATSSLRHCAARLLGQRSTVATASPTIVLYGLASSLFLAWLLYKAGAFLLAIMAQTLPSLIERASSASWAAWTPAEWLLATIGTLWQCLLVYVSLRLIASAPKRFAHWWQGSQTVLR